MGNRTTATRASSASTSALEPLPSPRASSTTYNYTPLPTRSGRVPQVPDPSAADTDRETMLFNDFFDWPSSDDEDPDFQPEMQWGDFAVEGGGNGGDETGNDTDFSVADDTFTPGDLALDDDFLAGVALDGSSVDAFAFLNQTGASTSRKKRGSTSVESPGVVAGTSSSSPRTARASTVRNSKRPRTTLSPLPEHPDLPVASTSASAAMSTASSTTDSSSVVPLPIPVPPQYPSNYLFGLDDPESLSAASHLALLQQILPSSSGAVPPLPTTARPPPAPASIAVSTPSTERGATPSASTDPNVPRRRGKGRKQAHMTPEELEADRRARNRLAAQQARKKKVSKLAEAECRVKELEEENARLRSRIEELEGGGGGERRRESSTTSWSVADSVADDEEDELEDDEEEEDRAAGPRSGARLEQGGSGTMDSQSSRDSTRPPELNATSLAADGTTFDFNVLGQAGIAQLAALLAMAAKNKEQ